MNEQEQLVERYLNTLGLGNVVYEPDGNITPDFVLAGKIAVEVRRLNQNFESPDGITKGLEEIDFSRWPRLKKLLLTLGPSINGESWYVLMDFRRPVGQWKPLEGKIRQALQLFMTKPTRQQGTVSISPNFKLNLLRASADHETFFLLGGSSDDDSGGWVIGELEKNLKLCIAEKELKITPHRQKYPEWWLVLVDHIAYGLDAKDREMFRTDIAPMIEHSFDRIILLDPRDHHRAFKV